MLVACLETPARRAGSNNGIDGGECDEPIPIPLGAASHADRLREPYGGSVIRSSPREDRTSRVTLARNHDRRPCGFCGKTSAPSIRREPVVKIPAVSPTEGDRPHARDADDLAEIFDNPVADAVLLPVADEAADDLLALGPARRSPRPMLVGTRIRADRDQGRNIGGDHAAQS